ncbi:MAG TPA: peptide deformylase [Magnetospirillaceae bacterium]|nr:peptide deformylase [Magnetospirillaceae bacterium]
MRRWILLDIPYVGGRTLPKGWHGPTPGLLVKYRRGLRYGLARSNAAHYRTSAQRFEGGPGGQWAIDTLQGFVSLKHEITALGMAHSQLAIAEQTGPLAVFAAMTEIAGLTLNDCRPGRVFLNPHIEPVVSKGKSVGTEPCFSCLATSLVAEVERWNAVVLTSDNQPPVELEGPAAVVAQHEYGHTLGELCVDVAFRTGRRVFYVPAELHQTFFADFDRRGRLHDYRHLFIPEQWEAVLNGEYTLEPYL